MDSASQVNNSHLPEPVRIIHKEQESISAFCLNLQNPGLLALATPRECQEMDITLLLESPNWLEDECELDIMNLTKDIDTQPASNFLMIQSSADKYVMNVHASQVSPILIKFVPSRNLTLQGPHATQTYATPSSPQLGIAGQSGRGTSVVSSKPFFFNVYILYNICNLHHNLNTVHLMLPHKPF